MNNLYFDARKVGSYDGACDGHTFFLIKKRVILQTKTQTVMHINPPIYKV